ncbi:MAG: hypothetical protein R2873_06595 [Caldilineaceae bacterium]|nr:hypothetical protein [Caldilineaceae bacterium]
MISHNMSPFYPVKNVDHFSFLEEWKSELRLFATGAGVGAFFGAILWLSSLTTTI